MSRIINVGASHDGKEEIIFHLRAISTAEETRYTNSYAEISDSDSDERRAEKEYEILTGALASWSVAKPTLKLDGKEVEESSEDALKGKTPAEAVAGYFADKTPEKERTAQQVVVQFRRKLQPKVVFY